VQVTELSQAASGADGPWWRSAVVYQIYPRSFADANGDGIGDLDGIRVHLDHLVWLGVDAIWLSPFYTSPMKDYGYDVSDYCDVDPIFGSLADFDALVSEAHSRGLRVLVDWVPNHTSTEHPWFVESRSSRDNPKRDWYIWRDPAADGGPPNNWISDFAGPTAWQLDDATGQYYLHLFLPEQADLNWRNPAVVEAMHGTLRFWLDRGVDGFRMDVIQSLAKRADLGDLDDPNEVLFGDAHLDPPATHQLIRGIRQLIDSYPGDRVAVGETSVLSTAKMASYYGDGDELHLCFNFPQILAPWDVEHWARRIRRTYEELDPRGAWPTWVLSNHDVPRHRTRYGGSEEAARAAVVAILTLRGTPFLYEGEELGLLDAVVPPEQRRDPIDRDGCRAPIPWTRDARHGWGPVEPWLPFPPEPDSRSVEAERDDPTSTLHLYRRLLALRHASSALRLGSIELLADLPEGVIGWDRVEGDDRRRVLLSFGEATVPSELSRGWQVDLASDGRGEGQPFDGVMQTDQTVVLSPTSG
jgi:alpha-glucosidase